jgi:hypothetical protein
LHIYDDKWLPDLAKFYQIRGGYHSSLGAPKILIARFDQILPNLWRVLLSFLASIT